MTRERLCLWLCGAGLAADLLRDPSAPQEPRELLEYLVSGERVSDAVAGRLKKLAQENWVDRELERCEKLGLSLLYWGGDDYPQRLNQIADPPAALYVKGCWPEVENSVSIVGTRRCSDYGFRTALRLGQALAQAGAVVVSGGARGIDGAAHSGALDGGGPTVAVLGNGVDRVWPRGHEELFDRIAGQGALVSEYPLGTPGTAWRFPRRNRIIAGLVRRVVVVESPLKGGSMHTARYAMEMGRELWAVPGRIDEKICEGSNRLLFEGATPLVGLPEFLESFCGLGQLELFPGPQLEGKAQELLKCLQEQGDLTVDQLALKTGQSLGELQLYLIELQSQGLVYPSGPGRWRASL